MRNFSNEIVEKIQTYILFSIFFFLNRAVYEISWANIVDRCRPQMAIWRMRIACRIPKSTRAHTSCVILIAFPLQQQWLHEHVSMLSYTYSTVLILL